MANRLGRAIDRARVLTGEMSGADNAKRLKITGQFQILWRRARLIRLANAPASMSALGAALLVIALFLTEIWQDEAGWVIAVLFVGCMA
jgi:hypothetical protein